MTDPTPHEDASLRELLSDAVSDIEPGHRLDFIRNRTKVTPMSKRRPWLYAVGGAAVATAAVIAAVAVIGSDLTGKDDAPVSSSPDATPPATTADEPTEAPSTSSTEVPDTTFTVPVYFRGEAAQGPRLFREFQKTSGADAALAATTLAVTGAADDPDYGSDWPAGVSVREVTVDPDSDPDSDTDSGTTDVELVTVDLDPGDAGDLRERPQGMSKQEASLAIEQVLYTVQASLQERAPVQLLVDGQRSDTILGVPTAEPLAQGEQLDVLALVNITDPTEGATVSGSFTATGVASSFEATVPWQIRQGEKVVDSGFTTAEGWMDKLYPWTASIDVSALEPGEYTFVAMTDDPTGGSEGFGPTEDTRTIVVE
ncbi:Gmad2 immunoglobulin-like domain-containing protein [Nocardioides pacificus]